MHVKQSESRETTCKIGQISRTPGVPVEAISGRVGGMSTQSTGYFKPAGWDESVVEDIDGEGETKNGTYYPTRGITTAKITYQYTGDIEGTGAVTYLFAYRDSKAGHADIIGYERFTGTIGGQEGTCVFRHTGSYADGSVSGHVDVLPGLGT